MQREISAGSDQVAAGRDQGRWQREIAVAVMKPDGSERSLLVAFVPQGIAAGCDQGGWQREIAASSVVQREIRAAVEGIREVGWLKGWWIEGCGFWGLFSGCFGCGLGLWFCGVLATIWLAAVDAVLAEAELSPKKQQFLDEIFSERPRYLGL
ncbi:hypothetical protein BHE74_00052581 [Ensete ventricosum]|nr:hypothetical protein BHE74_00052581 [Ensete ventricosum]